VKINSLEQKFSRDQGLSCNFIFALEKIRSTIKFGSIFYFNFNENRVLEQDC